MQSTESGSKIDESFGKLKLHFRSDEFLVRETVMWYKRLLIGSENILFGGVGLF